MIHPDTEIRFINDQIGFGVFATKFIPKGTITWTLDKMDGVYSPEEIEVLHPLYQPVIEKYCYRNSKGEFILCWDHARFVNHSFRSNCMSTAYEFEIAIRDIHPGEELTDDYGYLNITEPFECLPEPGTDRKIVHPDDLLRYYPVWDKMIAEVFPLIGKVNQPLKPVISNDVLLTVEQILSGKKKIDSILNCYYDESRRAVPAKAV